jgi:hypothetical protein
MSPQTINQARTTNKFSNNYGFFVAGQSGFGSGSPRQTNITQMNDGIKPNIDVEASIEERIEENILKLDPRRTASPPKTF